MADDLQRYADAIARIESGGRYGLVGPTHSRYGRALGRYQVMEANLPSWLSAAGLPTMTPEQFLASPEAQDAVFRHRFGSYVQRYGPEGAAQAWFAGPGSIGAPGAERRTDSLGTSVASYVRRFAEGLQQPPLSTGTRTASAPTQPPPSTTPTAGTPMPDVTSIVAGLFNGGQAAPGSVASLFNGGQAAPGSVAGLFNEQRQPSTPPPGQERQQNPHAALAMRAMQQAALGTQPMQPMQWVPPMVPRQAISTEQLQAGLQPMRIGFGRG